jgi:hypothetical protein
MPSIGETSRPGFVYDSATDTWIPVGIGPHAHTPAAIGAIASSVVTTKGDIIAATGSGVVVRQGVGADGSYLMADSSQADGLIYAGPSYTAGKNAIINGGMDIFQRTSFATNNAYSLDRWYINASTNTTVTQSTAKTTPNSQYMMLMTASGTQQIFAQQAIETKNAIYYAGKTVTLSAYAAGLTTTTNWQMSLSYSTSADNAITGSWTNITVASGNADLTLSSTVTRWSATYNVPSDAKTLRVLFVNNAANITSGQGIYLGDVQLELGSVATAFSRNASTIQGELAACQRYYYRSTALTGFQTMGSGHATSTTNGLMYAPLPVTMRVLPTSVDFSTLRLSDTYAWDSAVTALILNTTYNSNTVGVVYCTVASGATAGKFTSLQSNGSGYLGFSAEL